jgi:hypothetical protein
MNANQLFDHGGIYVIPYSDISEQGWYSKDNSMLRILFLKGNNGLEPYLSYNTATGEYLTIGNEHDLHNAVFRKIQPSPPNLFRMTKFASRDGIAHCLRVMIIYTCGS